MAADLAKMLQMLQSGLESLNDPSIKPTGEPAPNASVDDSDEYRQLSADINIVSNSPPADPFDRMREVYAIATAVHTEIYEALKVLAQNKTNMSLGMLCDCVLALREANKKLTDTVASINVASEGIQDAICLRYVADPKYLESGEQVYGNFCRGKPEYKARAKVPSFSKEPERYNAMMDWLGVPVDLRDRGKELYAEGEFHTKVVDVYYPGLQDMLQKYALNGIGTPDWLPPKEQDRKSTRLNSSH